MSGDSWESGIEGWQRHALMGLTVDFLRRANDTEVMWDKVLSPWRCALSYSGVRVRLPATSWEVQKHIYQYLEREREQMWQNVDR